METASGVKELHLFTRDGKVSSVSADMGKVSLKSSDIPVAAEQERMIAYPAWIGGERYEINCINVGNPHCVVFQDSLESLNLAKLGPAFEYDSLFPERVNAEFVHVVNRTTLRMRVWERGIGETMACGTGACAAVVAAVENGFCDPGRDVKVVLPGGDLIVCYSHGSVTLTGSVVKVYDGTFEY